MSSWKSGIAGATLAMAVVAGAAAPSAAATTICFGGDLGPSTCPTSGEQKIFLQAGTGTTGLGDVGSQGGLPTTQFDSTSTLDFANGFATIKPDTGKSFGDLKFTIPGHTFTDLLFDAQMFNNHGVDLNFTINAYDGASLLGSVTYTAADGLKHDADQSFVVLALGGPMTEIDLLSTSGFKELKHFEVSGIPELSTWAMMGLGFAALGFVGFHSRKRSVSIA